MTEDNLCSYRLIFSLETKSTGQIFDIKQQPSEILQNQNEYLK